MGLIVPDSERGNDKGKAKGKLQKAKGKNNGRDHAETVTPKSKVVSNVIMEQ
ncbi:MAG: hypothetical protein H0T73_06015 [Ardenticatenales bacterium]|nr:hypothetical protein [Ardenticatenales bacterium]